MMIMREIFNETYDEERALYNLKDALVKDCHFAGPADGESVLKEARNIDVQNCIFSLRYPMWHDVNYKLSNSNLDELTRAPLWYTKEGIIDNVIISSVKALRESENIEVRNSKIDSREFGWKCQGIQVLDSKINSEYIFLDSKDIKILNLDFTGKYSFQYTENVVIENSNLDTKDAFWHSKNALVKNSVIKGEYLGWFSDGLALINCKIIGTQPLCYCRNLKLVDCEMVDADLSFEYSDVVATIKGSVDSIKNPRSGKITVEGVSKIIKEGSIMEDNCVIELLDKRKR